MNFFGNSLTVILSPLSFFILITVIQECLEIEYIITPLISLKIQIYSLFF
jgi:hypothetical protein